ncbi:DUF736 domain-containing protein [Caulobacter sp. LARHSG274]
MSVIGHFRREGDGFTGRIATLGLSALLRLAPAARVSAKGPDYIVLVGDGDGESEVGGAWRAGDASGALLNIKLDDPSWPEPINVRLMAAENGVLPLTWIRKSDPPEKPPAPAPD